jgi:pimeloyl-ACP methyl ester carboxylesterase
MPPDLDGFELHYDVHGQGDALICVHGLGCDRPAWAMQIRGEFNTGVTEFVTATATEAVR